MKAVQAGSYGAAHETLTVAEVEKPAPAPNEVLIRVKATAVNGIDLKIRAGHMQQMMPMPLPFTPGWETAGIVESVGAGVKNLKAGDEVYTMLPFSNTGAYADYVTADAGAVALKPKSLSFPEAAAVPMVAGAAYASIIKTAHVQAGQKVLIHGAGGAVGGYAVQMAKQAGAYVIGTATGGDIERLKDLGADEVIDYRTTDFSTVVKDVDVVLDCVGGETTDKSFPVMKKGGLLVGIALPPDEEKAKAYGVRAQFVFTQPDPVMLDQIASWIDDGKLKPVEIQTMPMHHAARAHQAIEQKIAGSKIVLEA